MITNAFSIYDRKALRFHAPFFAVSVGEAVRSFTDAANDPQTTIARYPGDFVLYRVGAFDDASGQLQLCHPAEHVADADALVRVRPGQGDLFQPTEREVQEQVQRLANGALNPGA